MRKIRKRVMALAKSCVFVGMLAASSVVVAEEYPSKAVTVVVPFAAGGANDNNARFLADKLSTLWGKPVVIENRPGAGSTIGTSHVVRSKADGYTLLFTSTSLVTSAATQSKLTYDPVKDLQPIGAFGFTEQYVLVKKGSPIKNLQDLIAEAKKRTIFSGAAGIGAIGHFTNVVLDDAIGIKSEIVQYTGGSEVLIDLGGGRVDTFVAAGEAAREGVEALVVLSEKRSEALPDVPTIVEEGYPNAVVDLWFGVFAPAGTPTDVVNKINQDITTVMKASANDKYITSQGLRLTDASPEEFAGIVKRDVERWTTVAIEKGIRQ